MKFLVGEYVECLFPNGEKVLGTIYSINKENSTLNIILNDGSIFMFPDINCNKIDYVETYIKHFDLSNTKNINFKLNKGTIIIQDEISYLIQEDIVVKSQNSFKAMKV